MANKVVLILPFLMLGLVLRSQEEQPDSADVQKQLVADKKKAGSQWAQEASFFCCTEKQVAAMHILPSATQNDPPETRRAEPMKVFDNLYFVGTKEVTTWILTTPDGYIMIDSGYAGDEEKTMIPGMT